MRVTSDKLTEHESEPRQQANWRIVEIQENEHRELLWQWFA